MMKSCIYGLIRIYQLTLSPLLGYGCRFEPSCSRYARQAIEMHGIINGSWLAIRRVCRCHPYGGCGEDAVPQLRTTLTPRDSNSL